MAKRIPEGTIIDRIGLDAVKAYPLKYYLERNILPHIAYADSYTKNEQNTLNIKFIPNGSKRNPHPQIVFYINGTYHIETLLYLSSDPRTWQTWLEFHLDVKQNTRLIESLQKITDLEDSL